MQYVRSGKINLACRSWGDSTNPVLVLVHGYPDSSRVWLPVAKLLAKQYFVVAYDVRGCGYSSAPSFLWEYGMEKLEGDLLRILDKFSPDRPAHVVGHDWGSIQAWQGVTSPKLAGRIASFTSISGPCLDHVGHRLRDQFGGRRGGALNTATLNAMGNQAIRSWYVGFFHLPVLAPLMWQLGLDKYWPRLLEQMEGIEHAGSDPNQRKEGKNGINLYRANILPRLLAPQKRYAHAPVQIILPSRDPYVTEELYRDVDRWVPDLKFQTIDAGHWVLLSHPEAVAELITEFVEIHKAGGPSQPRSGKSETPANKEASKKTGKRPKKKMVNATS